MKISEVKEQIAEKLAVYEWEAYLIEHLRNAPMISETEGYIDDKNIRVDFPNKEFSFKNLELCVMASYGSSREEDSVGRSHKIVIEEGQGKFKYAKKEVSEIYDITTSDIPEMSLGDD